LAYRAVAVLLPIVMMVSHYDQRRDCDDEEREEANRKPNDSIA